MQTRNEKRLTGACLKDPTNCLTVGLPSSLLLMLIQSRVNHSTGASEVGTPKHDRSDG